MTKEYTLEQIYDMACRLQSDEILIRSKKKIVRKLQNNRYWNEWEILETGKNFMSFIEPKIDKQRKEH